MTDKYKWKKTIGNFYVYHRIDTGEIYAKVWYVPEERIWEALLANREGPAAFVTLIDAKTMMEDWVKNYD